VISLNMQPIHLINMPPQQFWFPSRLFFPFFLLRYYFSFVRSSQAYNCSSSSPNGIHSPAPPHLNQCQRQRSLFLSSRATISARNNRKVMQAYERFIPNFPYKHCGFASTHGRPVRVGVSFLHILISKHGPFPCSSFSSPITPLNFVRL
jgi:hypothetical protein